MGAKHIFSMMQLIMSQPPEVQLVAKKCLENNAYFTHPENIMCAMLANENSEVRKVAVERILNIRKKETKQPRSKHARGIRFFKPPMMVCTCTEYTTMIDCDSKSVNITKSPGIKALSDEELMCVLSSPLSLPNYPGHTTCVERCVKLVKKASKQVYG